MTQPKVLEPHRVIADRVRDLRKKRRWSAAQLAAELQEVGLRWDRSIVASFELGRRASVSVEELLALAYVLDVAPVHLLVPPDKASDSGPFYLVIPSFGARLDEARDWIRGREPIVGQDPRSFFAEAPEVESKMTPADVAAESARIQYHRKYGHQLRTGAIAADDYWQAVTEVEQAARAGADGER
ncbi:helix-turn-helix domain-containing protein [Verrucosispora sp. WMMD1129]|uniref:helix-turn-helix domain-containing protein n=1 Tax=Verrucosispora sp. WMMD1129 TaxID=3016093 RepID=UPI00249B628F|nr:helix-turn-helix domain-containing protein [Verrucosispora sp. WMMD1129]WFE45013.1 helix-turn-helix domain-containing protein [Verrucosispora sp. WMMD1129]